MSYNILHTNIFYLLLFVPCMTTTSTFSGSEKVLLLIFIRIENGQASGVLYVLGGTIGFSIYSLYRLQNNWCYVTLMKSSYPKCDNCPTSSCGS